MKIIPNKKDEPNQLKNFIMNLSRYSKRKTGFINERRRMIIVVGWFLLMQIIFIVIDGTFLEPNLNKMGNFASELAINEFFETWFFLYDNPIFKLVTTVALLHIIYVLIKTIILGFKESNVESD